MPEIILSDGLPFVVHKIGIFELDHLLPEPIGPFTYKINIMGTEYDTLFDIDAFEVPPPKPNTPESNVQTETSEWYDWQNYKLYQAGLVHDRRRKEKVSLFAEEVAKYILEKCCESNIGRIQTEEDWEAVCDAALIPQLTMDVIVETLRKTYAAQFNGEEIFKALERTKKGHGSYNVIKLWENKLMLELKMTEVQYALLSVDERARKVCALFLDDIMSYLEMDLEIKKSDGKSSFN